MIFYSLFVFDMTGYTAADDVSRMIWAPIALLVCVVVLFSVNGAWKHWRRRRGRIPMSQQRKDSVEGDDLIRAGVEFATVSHLSSS